MKARLIFHILTVTFLALTTNCNSATVTFDLNYPGAGDAVTLHVSPGKFIPLEEKMIPQREGYLFAGWFTERDCNEKYRWLCGEKKLAAWGGDTESMALQGDMTLYAKWSSPVHISSAEEFNAIRNDLYGWYILDQDIDLSGYDSWEPIGNYNSTYEYADAEWWDEAFHGVIDGNGHKITGLKLTKRSGFVNSLIGSLANGELKNLTVESPYIHLSGESIYASPLVAYMKNDPSAEPHVENCHVVGADIYVSVSNEQSTFSGATALVMAGWGGIVKDCSASGKIVFEVGSLPKGGELYVGALNGECYCTMDGCTSNVEILFRPADGAALHDVKAFVGALQSSAATTTGCKAEGSITVTDNLGFSNLCVGGIAGSERYGTIKDCKTTTAITVHNRNSAHVGSLVGEFSEQYGMIGAILGIKSTTIEHCTASTDNPFSGNGIPEPASSPIGLGKMGYAIEGCIKNP